MFYVGCMIAASAFILCRDIEAGFVVRLIIDRLFLPVSHTEMNRSDSIVHTPKSGDTTRCVNVVDNLGFPQVCVDKLNVFTTPILIRQWSKNSFCYVLLNIELANISRFSWHE